MSRVRPQNHRPPFRTFRQGRRWAYDRLHRSTPFFSDRTMWRPHYDFGRLHKSFGCLNRIGHGAFVAILRATADDSDNQVIGRNGRCMSHRRSQSAIALCRARKRWRAQPVRVTAPVRG
jgi:hypothetical protein